MKSPSRSVRRVAAAIVATAALAGCATGRAATPPARLVAPAAWSTVVDCVMLSARATELYAELDATGISITPGFTPVAQNRATSRAGVVGTVRINRTTQMDGLRVTTEAQHWDPAMQRRTRQPASATRAVAHQLDAQCLSTYPVVATE